LDEDNPTRFDFALCHLGINGKILASLAALFLLASCQTAAPPAPAESMHKVSAVTRPVTFTKQDGDRFLRAIRDDDIRQVRFFIAMGIDINKTYKVPEYPPETALSAAIDSRSEKSLATLFAAGVKPDALDDPDNSELIAAILSRQESVARRLIELGAAIDKKLSGSGETALMSAARVGLCGVLKALVDHGSRVNARNEDGYTALMYAAEYGHGDCVETLASAGADRKARNRAGKTARELASKDLSERIRKLLF
jgi:ankyrin repeat protein